ncbi:MAG: hypothetical protein HC897_16075 [Thermoanaerobaculia bacterium]|nr:hypothetical protein [Thermoanaerobaculia bacterium]
METAVLTVRLPKQDLEFAERYARDRHMTLSELVDRLLMRLRSSERIQAEAVQVEKTAWQELFRIGDALATEDAPGSQTLTAELSAPAADE